MKSSLYHLQINIDFRNIAFYKKLMEFLGWNVIFEDTNIIGFQTENSGDLWFLESQQKEITNYNQLGVNHIAIRVQKQQDIDSTIEYMKVNNVDMLFETPRHRPEFAANDQETYYQIMFESPDKILFEIVYIGPKDENND